MELVAIIAVSDATAGEGAPLWTPAKPLFYIKFYGKQVTTMILTEYR
jgi:hypothetical protein